MGKLDLGPLGYHKVTRIPHIFISIQVRGNLRILLNI